MALTAAQQALVSQAISQSVARGGITSSQAALAGQALSGSVAASAAAPAAAAPAAVSAAPSSGLGSAAYTQQLITQGNTLGAAASQQTGIPYTPVSVGTPATSAIGAGQTYLTAHPGMTELQVKDLYRTQGLDTKLREWRGTAEQWKAMSTFEEIAAGVAKATQQTAQIAPQVQTLQMAKDAGMPVTGTTSVESAATYLREQGITPPKLITDETKEIPTIEDTTTKLTPDTENVQMDSTDITDIINEITSGEFTTPGLELSEEAAAAGKADIERNAAEALKTLQQNLAKRGMTFSGIRTEAEKGLAAESLSKMSGISRALAGAIINAATQEQKRRESAIAAQQKAQSEALKAMGYVVNPYTGKMEKTMEREKMEQPDYQTVSSGGNIFEYDKGTGALRLMYEAPQEEKDADIKFFEDAYGNITKVVSDPVSGAEFYRENLGAIGKGFKDTEGKITSADRMDLVDTFIQGRTGDDGLISAGTYVESLRTWIANEGNESEFKTAYPPEAFMGSWEIAKLPANLKVKTPDVSDTEQYRKDFNKKAAEVNAGKNKKQAIKELQAKYPDRYDEIKEAMEAIF